MPKGVYERTLVPLYDRFLRMLPVERSADSCWNWQGYVMPNGYGTIGRGRKSAGMLLAHRAAYELFNGPIPADMHVMHRCDNPTCVNPAHLRVGPREENMRDMHTKSRSRWKRTHGTLDGHKPDTRNDRWKTRKRNEKGQFDNEPT